MRWRAVPFGSGIQNRNVLLCVTSRHDGINVERTKRETAARIRCAVKKIMQK